MKLKKQCFVNPIFMILLGSILSIMVFLLFPDEVDTEKKSPGYATQEEVPPLPTKGISVSRGSIKGGVYNGYIIDNNYNYTEIETPYNSPTSNKVKRPCPPYISGICCDNDCSPEERQDPDPILTDEQAGEPVNLNNLEFTVEEVDMEIPGRGINFRLKRTYRSRINFSSSRLGWNWCHNYYQRLKPHPSDPNNAVIYYNGYGRGDTYTLDSNENYVSPKYHFKKLVKDKNGYLLLRNRNGTICKFYPLDGSPAAGRLAAIITRCRNKMKFQYDIEGKLSNVIDSLNRPINYYYNADGRLERVVDFIGREVRYSYSRRGDLIEVTGPAVTNTPNGNDFPNGKTVKYTYSKELGDNSLNHNLLTITRPNEVAAGGAHSVINHYDENDRLVIQEWGGTNASGIKAGGTISYAREEVNANGDPNDLDLPREVVTVTDRSGNVTIYSYNINKNLVKKEEKTREIRPGDLESFITQFKYTETGLLIEILYPEGNKSVYEYDTSNVDQFQTGNLLSLTRFPDSTRPSSQEFLKRSYIYEPVYNQVWKVIEERGNDPSYKPQNGGNTSPQRYTTEYIPDYFEGDLNTPSCCGQTLGQLVEMYDIEISSIMDQLDQGDLNGDGNYSNCGNIIVTRYPTVHLRSDSPQTKIEGSTNQVIEARTSYNKYSQVDWMETPEGEITKYLYYPETNPHGNGKDIRTGNSTSGQPFDELTGGYLKEIIADHSHSPRYRGSEAPVQVHTKMGYDRVGNIIFTIDGRGIRTNFVVNQLNQIVEVIRAADVSESPEKGLVAFAYKSRIYYDSNDNVVKTEFEYRDGNSPDLPQYIDTSYTYDILDNLLETTSRVSNSETITTRYRYDPNENKTEILTPMAVNGTEPQNKIRMTYDERDLLYEAIQAPESSLKIVETRNYDLNGNLQKLIGPEDNDKNGERDFTLYFYDGFDRLEKKENAVGNITEYVYDPASNVVETKNWGSIVGPGRTNSRTRDNVLLAQSFTFYDELSREYRIDRKLFLPDGVSTTRPVNLSEGDLYPGDKRVTGFVDYDRNSRIIYITAPSPENALIITTLLYDGLSRVIKTKDAEGNEVTSQYDKNSNVIRTIILEKNSAGRIPDEFFTTIDVYDSLNRLIRTTDNVGQTRRFYYDSRDRLINTTDAQGPSIPDPLGLYTKGNINGDGNVGEIIHDGLGRTLQTIRVLTIDGQGGNEIDLSNPSNPDGKIIENMQWDVNSRLISVSDDKSNLTTYTYDELNRLRKTIFADNTENSHTYDRNSQVIEYTDNNGTIVKNTYDPIGRLIRLDITPTEKIVGTTQQTFEYDGLSHLTRFTDNNDPANSDDDSTVERKYDSLSRIVEEIQKSKVISFNWTRAADPVDITYPNDRIIKYTLDKLNRLQTITHSDTSLASYDYIGSRMIERIYANGTRFTTLNDEGTANEGYDNLGRLTKIRHLKNTTLIAGYGYGYSRENIKTYKENLLYSLLSELYKYDSIYRIPDFKRGKLNADKNAIEGTPLNAQTWQLDGVGNWAITTVDGQVKTQSINNMNEYDRFNGIDQVHDHNGNRTDDNKFLYSYDFQNRIVAVRDKDSNTLAATYRYDSFNRRISKTFTRDKGPKQYQTDPNTLALFHYELTGGQLVDSAGNVENVDVSNVLEQVPGLFNTQAARFSGTGVALPKTPALNNFTDQITLEAWIYLEDENAIGDLIKRQKSYSLEIIKRNRKLQFVIILDGNDEKYINSNDSLPLKRWVHVAGVYNGSEISMYINGVKQKDTIEITGNIQKKANKQTWLGQGDRAFFGIMEEARISNIGRTSFDTLGLESVQRDFYYNGWQVVEERELTAPLGQKPANEKVTRQFVDGAGIDDHLCMDIYNTSGTAVENTYWFHKNARGDTTALTDNNGDVVLRLAYSPYGEIFKVNENGELEPFTDFASVVYAFQGRRKDEETGLYYFRRRYYDDQKGRFLQRDPRGYEDSLGTYQFGENSPLNFGDPYGLKTIIKEEKTQIKVIIKYAVWFKNKFGKHTKERIKKTLKDLVKKWGETPKYMREFVLVRRDGRVLAFWKKDKRYKDALKGKRCDIEILSCPKPVVFEAEVREINDYDELKSDETLVRIFNSYPKDEKARLREKTGERKIGAYASWEEMTLKVELFRYRQLEIFHEIGHTFGLPDYYKYGCRDGYARNKGRWQYNSFGRFVYKLASGPMVKNNRSYRVSQTDIFEILNDSRAEIIPLKE